jgi:hypothetical protein
MPGNVGSGLLPRITLLPARAISCIIAILKKVNEAKISNFNTFFYRG